MREMKRIVFKIEKGLSDALDTEALKQHRSRLFLLPSIDDDLKLNAEISKIYDEIISEELKKEFKEAISNEGNEENHI